MIALWHSFQIAMIGVLLLTFAEQEVKAEVTFLSQPHNVTTVIGGTAFFPCTYNGTSGLPKWNIGDRLYSYRTLPRQYRLKSTGLLVTMVTASMNGQTYSCLFDVYSRDALEYQTVESTTGYLIVVSSLSPTEVLSHIQTFFVMPTMKPTVPASTVITIKTYVSESQSLTKLKVVKNFNATQEQKSSKLNFVYGAAGIGCFLTASFGIIVTSIIVCRAIALKRKRVNLTSTSFPGNGTEPLYEEIPSLPEHKPCPYDNIHGSEDGGCSTIMSQNECYGSSKRIKLNKCPAYNTVHVQPQRNK